MSAAGRSRTRSSQFSGQANGSGDGLLRGRDCVDEAPREGFICADSRACNKKLQRTSVSDEA